MALDFSRPLGLLHYAKAFCQYGAVQIVFKIFQSSYVDLPIKKKIIDVLYHLLWKMSE